MASYLAFDLGAGSGRAMLGRYDGDRLSLEELARFPNAPVDQDGSLRWDVDRLWAHVRGGLARAAPARPASIGVDTWGCDYALIRAEGTLVERPYCYRDRRTDGVMDEVFARVPAAQIYAKTGIQFLPFNTLYQLYAARTRTPEALDAAATLLTIPDLLNFHLTGRRTAEFTNATTTQCVDAMSRTWATDLLEDLDMPTRLLAEIVEPATPVGTVQPSADGDLAGTPVVAPACHDTGSAVASIAAGGTTAFLSSGTWSLLGTELDAPLVTSEARVANFTNEGGVAGTTRLLKNIGGLWLLESCRREWAERGLPTDYEALLAAATTARPFRSLVDPDAREFLHPPRMTEALAAWCRRRGQPEPGEPAAVARAVLESLAFKYRSVLESLEQLTGRAVTTIRVIGGGAQNRLLNQFTANATGRAVVAGPVEATALGNIGVQMLATGAVGSLAEARTLIDHAFPAERFAPRDVDLWEREFARFRDYLELTRA